MRRRETPTRIVEHALSECPDCGRALTGGTVKRVRQVIEIPTPAVEIIEHRFIARRCGYCGKAHVAKVDLGDQVVGKRRVGGEPDEPDSVSLHSGADDEANDPIIH